MCDIFLNLGNSSVSSALGLERFFLHNLQRRTIDPLFNPTSFTSKPKYKLIYWAKLA